MVGHAIRAGLRPPLGRITLLGRAALPGPLLGLLSDPLLGLPPGIAVLHLKMPRCVQKEVE